MYLYIISCIQFFAEGTYFLSLFTDWLIISDHRCTRICSASRFGSPWQVPARTLWLILRPRGYMAAKKFARHDVLLVCLSTFSVQIVWDQKLLRNLRLTEKKKWKITLLRVIPTMTFQNSHVRFTWRVGKKDHSPTQPYPLVKLEASLGFVHG